MVGDSPLREQGELLHLVNQLLRGSTAKVETHWQKQVCAACSFRRGSLGKDQRFEEDQDPCEAAGYHCATHII